MPAQIKNATPFAVKQSGSRISLWFSTFGEEVDTTIVNLECVDEDIASIAVAALHAALGLRPKESSFTTGLLHRDIELIELAESKRKHPASWTPQEN